MGSGTTILAADTIGRRAYGLELDPLYVDVAVRRWQAFTGQSGHPASQHYDDLQADWQAGRTQPMAGDGPWRTLNLEPVAS